MSLSVRGTMLCLLPILAAASVPAATFNVTGGGNALATAITSANGAAGADIISINDSLTYSGDLPAVTESVTILASGANAPTISKTAATNNPTITEVFRFSPTAATGVFTLQGSGSGTKMVVENLLNTSPVVTSGPTASKTHNVVITDVILRKDAAHTGSILVLINENLADNTLTRVVFGTRSSSSTEPVASVGSTDAVGPVSGGSVVFNTCDLRSAGTAAACLVQTNAPGFGAGKSLQFISSTIEPDPTGAAAGMFLFELLHTTGNVTVSAGTMGTGGTSTGWPGCIAPTSVAAGTATFKDVVWKACGALPFDLNNAGTNNMNYVFQGTLANAKMDLSPVMTGGISLLYFIRTRGADVTFTNCFSSPTGGSGRRLVYMNTSTPPGALFGTVNVSLTNCEFNNEGGAISAADSAASSFEVHVTALNCIWRGTSLQGPIALTGSRTGAAGSSTISLDNCTLAQSSPSGLVNGVAPRDVLTAHNCIFDATATNPTNAASQTLALNGATNISYRSAGAPNGGFTPGEPGDTVNVDPLLDATKRLLTGSPAIDAGVSVLPTTDIDGESRPMGAASDIGADEFTVPPTASPTPTATPTATQTPTASATPTATLSPTATATLSPTPTATLSPTATPTASSTPTPTLSPTATATLSPTATATLSPTATATLSPTPTATLSPTATATLSPTATATLSATPTPTLSPTATPTASPSASPSPSASATPTPTLSPTATATVSATATPTLSPSPSPSASATPTHTPTHTPTATATATATDTPTATATETDTPTATATETDTPTATATATISGTPSPSPSPNAAGEWELYE